jgi:TatD DNase family protein
MERPTRFLSFLFVSLTITAPTSLSRLFVRGFSREMTSLRFVDIGANLLDGRFTKGIYHDKQRHEPDFDQVVERAAKIGVKHIIMTAGSVDESANAVREVRRLRQSATANDMHFSCTVGVHPTRCLQEFVESPVKDEDSLQRLLEIAKDGMTDGAVVAIGEIGLDYDRLQFTPKDVQHKYFIKQLQVLAANTGLPLFLHNRSVGSDLYDILKEHEDCWKRGGVVHSFDDSYELAMKFITDLGLYIGLNGCSLREKNNLQVAKELPLDKILLETDCPYCEVKRTHAGFHHIKTTFPAKQEKKFELGVMVKGRCEPCQIIQVAEVLAGVKELSLQDVADQCFENSQKLYGWNAQP